MTAAPHLRTTATTRRFSRRTRVGSRGTPGGSTKQAAHGGWTYSETIDADESTIRVRGRVDRLGVDLLRGTIEELSRRGHRDITVTMDDDVDVDPAARTELDELVADLTGRHVRLTIRRSHPDEEPA